MSNLRTSIADYVPAGESKERRNITAPAAHFILPFPAGSRPRCLREMPSGGRSPPPPPHGSRRAEAQGQPVGSDRSPVPGGDTPAPAPAFGELAAAVPRRGCSGWKGRGGSRGVLAMRALLCSPSRVSLPGRVSFGIA